jgi:hypothetical protein
MLPRVDLELEAKLKLRNALRSEAMRQRDSASPLFALGSPSNGDKVERKASMTLPIGPGFRWIRSMSS